MIPLIAGKLSSTALAVCCTAGVVDDANLRMICGNLRDSAKYAEGGAGQPSANSLLSYIATGPAASKASLQEPSKESAQKPKQQHVAWSDNGCAAHLS